MASTRLPGQAPGRDRRRADDRPRVAARLAAEVGPVVVACAEPAIAEAVAAHGGEALLTDPELPSRHRSHLSRPLSDVDPERRFERVINLQGDLPTLEPAAIRACARAPGAARQRHRHARRGDRGSGGDDRSERRQGGDRLDRRTRGSAGRSISRARRRRPARARSTTTSASMPIGGRRWSASRRCRRARSSAASGSSSCARSRPA